MEGGFPRDSGEQTCLRIAEAADLDSELDDGSTGRLPIDPPAGLPQADDGQSRTSKRHALPITLVGQDSADQQIPEQPGVAAKRQLPCGDELKPKTQLRLVAKMFDDRNNSRRPTE